MKVVIPRDGQAVAITAIAETLPALGLGGVPVDTTFPATLPARFLTVVQAGTTPDSPMHSRALLEISAYVAGSDDAAALSLCNAAVAVLMAHDGETVAGAFVSDVDDVSGAANLPDPRVPTYQRARATVEVATRSRIADI